MESFLLKAWQRRTFLIWCLWPFSLVFKTIISIRQIAYQKKWLQQKSVNVPVIIVGNLTVGGTGKTPTVIALVEALRLAGFIPGVISRGYPAVIKNPLAVTTLSNASAIGDEPLLIVQRTAAPLFVCKNRYKAAQALLIKHPEVNVILSDDGLQHYALARHYEIIVFDSRLGGNGFLLPAGPLRESLKRKRDATLINDANMSKNEKSYHPSLSPWPNTYPLHIEPAYIWHLNTPHLRYSFSEFANQFSTKTKLAAAGIGAPARFFSMLRAHHIISNTEDNTRALPDHYAYQKNPFIDEKADIILITEKDAVKCHHLNDARLWAVAVSAKLDPIFIDKLMEKICEHSFT